jgi:MFS family permease
VAIAILVYGRTHSPFLTALAYALTYLPPIAGGPLLSGLADLFPRRRVMIVCDLFRVGTVGLMAIPGMPFAALCVLLFCTVLTGVPFSSARAALMPDVLPATRSCSAPPSATSPTRPARSSASSRAPPSSPCSTRTRRWASTP